MRKHLVLNLEAGFCIFEPLVLSESDDRGGGGCEGGGGGGGRFGGRPATAR